MAIASPGKNWGFCSDECQYVHEPYHHDVAYSGLGLMVYLSDDDCKKYLGVNEYQFNH